MYLSIFLSIQNLCIHLLTYLPTYLFIYLSTYLPIYQSIDLSIHPSIYVSILLKIIPKPVRSATPRFGRAVARVRSRHLKRQRKAAASFIRKALKGDDRLDMTKKSNQLWMEMANLKPIFQFLSKQWSTTVDHEMLSRCGVPTSKLNHLRCYVQIAGWGALNKSVTVVCLTQIRFFPFKSWMAEGSSTHLWKVSIDHQSTR